MFDDDTDGDDQRPRYTIWRDDEARQKIDLSQFTTEAMLAEQLRTDAQKKGVPFRHYDPNFKPRHHKGVKLDKDSDEHRGAAEAAVRGLPLWSSMTWCETQLFDNGPSEGRHAHTRFVLKFTATSAAAGALVNEDRRALSVTRHCYLSTPKNFLRNLKRKKAQHALTQAEWDVVGVLMENVAATEAVEGQPSPLVGALSCKLHGEGTLRSVGQFAMLSWEMREGEWRPNVLV